MPRAYVDFSIYSAYQAQGNVHGMLELPSLPRVGESVSFAEPIRPVPLPDVRGFVPRIAVEHILQSVPGGHDVPSFSLADVKVVTTAEAMQVFAYFENGFGLYADRLQA